MDLVNIGAWHACLPFLCGERKMWVGLKYKSQVLYGFRQVAVVLVRGGQGQGKK
tara:strand:- start:136 stop:297 length:162 start_codon:yes stop_codon:yes gene_type:complete